MNYQPSQSKNKSPMQKSEMHSVESELSDAKKAVRDLALKIEESNSRSKGSQRRPKWCEQKEVETSIKIEEARYAQVMKELEHMKQELAKLKGDMARVLKEKRRAERSAKASTSKRSTLSASIELMKKEMQELGEEQALVEFARIEAVKECESIEGRRTKDYTRFQTRLLEAKNNIADSGLQMTVFDMDKKQEEGTPVNKIMDELEATKQELASIKGEGFNFMTSMDVIRDELKHVRDETARLYKAEQKRDLTVQTLNSNILRSKAKLESLVSAEKRSNIVAANLVITLEQLRAEIKTSKKDKDVIDEEIGNMNGEIRRTESEIEVAEERLEAAMKDLKAIKLSESKALGSLRDLINATVEARDMASMNDSLITITGFEYEYLAGKASGAAEVADKKIAAAQAWVEALKANEREILMKLEMTQREISELSVEEQKQEQEEEEEEEVDGPSLQSKVVVTPRKSTYRVGTMGTMKRAKLQRLRSPAARYSGKPGSLKKEKMMPKLAKFFSHKNVEMDV